MTCAQKNCTEKPDPLWPDSIGPAAYERWAIPDVISSKVCLKPMVPVWAPQLIRLYLHYKNGLLPYAGGILDQPNSFLVGMEIIDSTVNGGKV